MRIFKVFSELEKVGTQTTVCVYRRVRCSHHNGIYLLREHSEKQPWANQLHAHKRTSTFLYPPLTFTMSSNNKIGRRAELPEAEPETGIQGYVIYQGRTWKKRAVRRWGKQAGEEERWRVEEGRPLQRCTPLSKEFSLLYPSCQSFTTGWVEKTLTSHKEAPDSQGQFFGERDAVPTW